MNNLKQCHMTEQILQQDLHVFTKQNLEHWLPSSIVGLHNGRPHFPPRF